MALSCNKYLSHFINLRFNHILHVVQLLITKGILMKQFLSVLAIAGALSAIDLPVYHETMGNGLELFVVPDTNVAVVSCRLYYKMGSYYEGPGTTGLSHMYEHMMFKGTKRLGTIDYAKEIPYMNRIDSMDQEIVQLKAIGHTEEDSLIQSKRKIIFSTLDSQRVYIKKDEIWSLFEKNGATGLNAWTSDDLTAYIVTLPANKVELFFNVEADRMENLVLREFYSERDVVTEERRMRYDNRPLGRYWERLSSLFYAASPYRNPTIGWYSDIRNYTVQKMEEHIDKYYRPDNAMLILSGNISIEQARKLTSTYFDHIKKPSKPLDAVVTREPDPVGEVRFTHISDGEPRLDLMFHTPGYPDSALLALDVVENILSGTSGRLYKRLVEESQLCTNAGAGNSWQKNEGYFQIWASLKDGTDPKVVEDIILEEIAKAAESEPSQDELMQVTNKLKFNFLSGLNDLEGISDQLAFFSKLGNWKQMLTYAEDISSVKSTTWAVEKYLNPEFRTVGILINPKKEVK